MVNNYHEQPQKVAQVDHWLTHIREGIEGLQRLGHVFHLAPGSEPGRKEWPRMVYHAEKARLGFYCLCQQDFEILGGNEAGWFDTLDEAKHELAVQEQWKRGGVFPKYGLPVVEPEEDGLTPLERKRRRGLLDANGHLSGDV